MIYNFIRLILVVILAGSGCQNVTSIKKEQGNPERQTREEPAADKEVVPDDEPQLLIDEEPLLLLDDEPDESLSSESMADNSRCFVCHINYMQEEIAVTHARQDMGCADCHGESDEHIADESWASGGNGTAPDRMFTRPQINPFCMGCHTGDKIDTEQHKSLFENINDTYCTDCHGDHRLSERTCKWK